MNGGHLLIHRKSEKSEQQFHLIQLLDLGLNLLSSSQSQNAHQLQWQWAQVIKILHCHEHTAKPNRFPKVN